MMHIQKIKEKYDKKDGSLYGKNNIEDSLAMLYHENSKFTSHSLRTQGEIIGSFSSPFITERCVQPYKCYPGQVQIDLNAYIKSNPAKDFFTILHRRKSIRDYQKDYKISLNELGILLYNSYGVTKKSKIEGLDKEAHLGFRNVPSGGGLYPLEMYIVLFKSHIPLGLYHYRPDINCLEEIKQGLFLKELSEVIQAEPYTAIQNASAIVMTTGLIERQTIKYGERAYRFLMQESGAVGQNISLIAETLQLGACWVGGYLDDKLNEFLGIDGVFETINNVIIIGKKQEKTVSDSL
ncbi:MAG: SagB/ThcOx family dehydrogenase [Flavobacteriaceae bacterium]|nr:MAG: SagB/ThcOx family dehydrogenase [Flavobacteriaceae bacterium]